MKNVLTMSFLLIVFTNTSFCQSISCCDSLIKLYNNTATKAIRKINKTSINKRTNKTDNNLSISIENHNTNNPILRKEKESCFDIFFKYFKEIFGPMVALLGILLTLPILKKKLLENHITTSLNKIQETNAIVHRFNQNLIDEYLPLTYSNDLLAKGRVEQAFLKIKEAYYLSLEGSSDVVTLLFYLKNTIQGTLKHYNSTITSREIFGLIINVLETTNFYCTQIVQVPKSSKTETKNIINKKLQKYVTHSDYLKYKYFNQGIIFDPNSAHYTLFYSQINSLNNILIKRAAFQIYESVAPVAKLLLLSEMYAPLEIVMPHKTPFLGGDTLKLYLIGYTTSISLTMADGSTKKVVDLIYSNPDDFYRFASSLKYTAIQENFKDSFITTSNFELNKSTKMSHGGIETFSLQFDQIYLKTKFQENKKRLKEKISAMIKKDL